MKHLKHLDISKEKLLKHPNRKKIFFEKSTAHLKAQRKSDLLNILMIFKKVSFDDFDLMLISKLIF